VKDEKVYLDHILQSIASIQLYVAEGRASLDVPQTQDAVIRRLQIMIESALRLPPERLSAFPDIE